METQNSNPEPRKKKKKGATNMATKQASNSNCGLSGTINRYIKTKKHACS